MLNISSAKRSSTQSSMIDEKAQVRELLLKIKGYSRIEPKRFYLDLLFTGVAAWGGFILMAMGSIPWGLKLFCFLVSYLAFYRGLAFIHEVVHFHKKIPHLDQMYNLLFGYPNRVPLYTHTPHRMHHLPTTFATIQDPEYLYMEGRGVKVIALAFVSGLLAPLLLVLRFGVAPLFYPLIGRLRYRALLQRASTIVVNPNYKREVSQSEENEYLKQDLICAFFFLVFVVLLATHVLPFYMVGVWYAMMVIGSTANIWRARIAHRYDNKMERLSPFAQIRDSVTVDNTMLSWFWAPLGLQYHSLHHLAPNIPYYNLKAAHQTLCTSFEDFKPYHDTRVEGFWLGVKQFCDTAIAKKPELEIPVNPNT